MLSGDEDLEIDALKQRGWSISAIARHVGRDRKTVRGYLNGEREVGVRKRDEPDPFDEIEACVRQRLTDDQLVWATVLFAEVAALGYPRAYATFTRQLRDRGLRPHCERCSSSKGRAQVGSPKEATLRVTPPQGGDFNKQPWGVPASGVTCVCEVATFTEQSPAIAAPRAGVTDRAGRWMTRQSAKASRPPRSRSSSAAIGTP